MHTGRPPGETAIDPAQALRRWGRTAFAFDTLQNPSHYRFFASRAVPGAVVPYRSVGRVDVVVGEPLAPEASLAEVVREFFTDRTAAGRLVLGFLASEAFARAAVSYGASAVQLTSEPELDPVSWEPTGGSAKKMRQYVNRLRKSGIDGVALPRGTQTIAPEFRVAAEALIRKWIAKGVARPAQMPEAKRYFAVFDPKSTDRMWSLLIAHPVPALGGWHLCHLVRDPDAPKGVAELAVTSALETLGEEGVRYATFGPFAAPEVGEFLGVGPLMQWVVRKGYAMASKTGGYARSVEFYRKVQPNPWRPRFMVFFPRRAVLRNFFAGMRLTHVFGYLDRG
jgi:lysylphosphatidylglycerol synthetase-like protein (DUF2156 family)